MPSAEGGDVPEKRKHRTAAAAATKPTLSESVHRTSIMKSALKRTRDPAAETESPGDYGGSGIVRPMPSPAPKRIAWYFFLRYIFAD